MMMTDEQAAGEAGVLSAGAIRGYVCPRRDQLFLLPVCMRDWLEEGHLAWFVLDVVAELDTAALHRRPGGCTGRPPYEPEMVLALLLYAYCCGVRSSRRIEAACRTDAAYRVICGGLVPDHATIARFVVDHERALGDLFVSGLRLCAAAGLADLAVVALDGTKLGADASLDRNRDAAWIRGEVSKLMEVTAQDEQPAAARPEGLPGVEPSGEISSPRGRAARLKAALAVIEAEDAAAGAAAARRASAAAAQAERGRKLGGRKPQDPLAALARAEIDHQAASERVNTMQAARERKLAAAARGEQVKRSAAVPDREGEARAGAGKSRARRRSRGGRGRHDRSSGEYHRSRQSDHEHRDRLGAGLQRPGNRQPASNRARVRGQPRRHRRPALPADDRHARANTKGRWDHRRGRTRARRRRLLVPESTPPAPAPTG